MKRCPSCGRVLKKKSWKRPTPADLRKSEVFEPFQKEWCNDCMKRGESHNAILQVRGIPIEKIEPIVDKLLDANAKKGVVENGYKKDDNFYFSLKATARKIAVDLKKMGAEIKETNKLITYDQLGSKSLYRLTISARFRIFPGDLVETPAGPDVVLRTANGWAWTRAGKKFKIKDAKKLEAESFEGIIISEKPPMALVVKTGESVELEGALSKSLEEKIELKQLGGKWWVV